VLAPTDDAGPNSSLARRTNISRANSIRRASAAKIVADGIYISANWVSDLQEKKSQNFFTSARISSGEVFVILD